MRAEFPPRSLFLNLAAGRRAPQPRARLLDEVVAGDRGYSQAGRGCRQFNSLPGSPISYNALGGSSMIFRAICIGMLSVVLCAAADKLPTGSASNDNVEVAATLHNGKEAVQAVVGSDLGRYSLIVE